MTRELDLVRAAYHDAADQWATSAELAYRPMAAALLERVTPALDGATVLDVGAGTGAVSHLAHAAGARPVAIDASPPMLRHGAAQRPPAIVADAARLPLASGCVDGAIAAFVLNHLADPVAGLRELGRVVRPGGFVLASTFSAADRAPAKTTIDEVLRHAGWRPPAWYRFLKAFERLLGSTTAMHSAAERAGLSAIDVEERTIDTGITDPAQIVHIRCSLPHIAGFLAALPPALASDVIDAATLAVAAHRCTLTIAVVMLGAHATPPPTDLPCTAASH